MSEDYPVSRLPDSDPPSLPERAKNEIVPTVIEAGAVFAVAMYSQGMHPDDRFIAMFAVTGLAGLAGYSIKERGIINDPLKEIGKTAIFSVAAAFAADNKITITLPDSGSIVNAGSSAINEQGPNLLKGIAAAGGLAIAGWGGAKVAVKGYEIASNAVEKGREAAVRASNKVRQMIANRLRATADVLSTNPTSNEQSVDEINDHYPPEEFRIKPPTSDIQIIEDKIGPQQQIT